MKDLTVSQITSTAIKILESRYCFVWRQNNIAVRGRTFTGMRGMPDIIGYHMNTGVAVYCEVKTKKDKLSEYQITFLNKAKASGCHCLLAVDDDGEVKLKDWTPHD